MFQDWQGEARFGFVHGHRDVRLADVRGFKAVHMPEGHNKLLLIDISRDLMVGVTHVHLRLAPKSFEDNDALNIDVRALELQPFTLQNVVFACADLAEDDVLRPRHKQQLAFIKLFGD